MSSVANIRLTASEIATLWTQHQNDTLAICILKFLESHAKDDSIRRHITFAVSLSQNHVNFIKQTFENEGCVIPVGFSEEDVNLNAKQLFSECFALQYLNNMSRLGIASYGLGLGLSARADMREFYKENVNQSMVLNDRVVGESLEKGLYLRPPIIPSTKKVHFAEKQSFLGSLFKETRPLTAIEIMNLFTNLQTNVIGKAMMTAFSQVASTQKIRDYFIRGKEIAQKHIDIFTKKLSKDDLTGTLPIEPLITDSQEAPFSDKLMLFHTAVLIQAGIGNYGLAISSSQRSDLVADYARLMAEAGAYSEDGANILIENGWFEEPPQAVDRNELAIR